MKKRKLAEIIELIEKAILKSQADPKYQLNLPIQQQVEYLWNQYQSLDPLAKNKEWLWTHFLIGQALTWYYQKLRDNDEGKNDAERQSQL